MIIQKENIVMDAGQDSQDKADTKWEGQEGWVHFSPLAVSLVLDGASTYRHN